MKRWLPLLLLCPLVFAQVKVAGPSKIAGPERVVPGGGVDNQIGPLDFVMDLNCSGPGTAISTTILNCGTFGNANHGGWAVTGAGLTVAAPVAGCPLGGSTQVNGTVYPIEHYSQSMAVDNSGFSRNISVATPNLGYLVGVAEVCFKIGAANDGAGSSLFDVGRFLGNTGGSQYVLQLQNGTANNCGAFALNIEYINSGGTQHSSCNTGVTSGGTYKVVFYADATGSGDTGHAQFSVYDTSNVQVGSTITVTNGPTADVLLNFCLGSCSAHGTSTGSNQFQNLAVRWNAKPVVLSPTNTTQDPVYWIAQAHGFHGSGAVTTQTASPALDEHSGDRVYVWCSNENASAGVCTAPTNTAGETFTKVTGSESSANAQTINVWQLSVAADHAGQTYTCNQPSTAFINCHVFITRGGTATDVAAIVNTSTGANMTTASFNPTTSTGLSLMCGYKQAGSVLITAGANYYGAGGVTTQSWGCMARPNTPSGSQTAQMIHSDSAASVGSLVNIKQ